MYIMACLCILKIYQNRHPDISANSHSSYMVMALIIIVDPLYMSTHVRSSISDLAHVYHGILCILKITRHAMMYMNEVSEIKDLMYKGPYDYKSHHHVRGMGVGTDVWMTILVEYTQACHSSYMVMALIIIVALYT